jgi:predicted enzyme related to lactoylglutathione lyase
MTPLLLLLLAGLPGWTSDDPAPEVWGLRRDVTELARAQRFYEEALGFRLEARAPGDRAAVLVLGELRLLLRVVPGLDPGAVREGFSLNLQVADLEAAAGAVAEAGGRLDAAEPEPIAVGRSWPVLDPDGHAIHLMDLSSWREAPAAGCLLFNLGRRVEDLGCAERVCESLGWSVSTRDYLPRTLPLARSGVAPLVFHRGGVALRGAPASALLLSVPSPEAAGARLRERGLEPAPSDPVAGPLGRLPALLGPGSARVELLDAGPAKAMIEAWPAARPAAGR